MHWKNKESNFLPSLSLTPEFFMLAVLKKCDEVKFPLGGCGLVERNRVGFAAFDLHFLVEVRVVVVLSRAADL